MTRKGASVVNHYKYTPNTELNILTFNEMTDEWLDFVADCRRGIEHDYDIVEGPMADDQIWNFVEGFIDGRIPRDAFWGLVRFNYPTLNSKEDFVDGIIRVYNNEICDVIDNYNCSAFYEPSYVIARAYQNGGF